MFRRIMLWWQIRQCEKALLFLRDWRREHPEDVTVPPMIAKAEAHYVELISERVSRNLQMPFVFDCTFCGKENRIHVRPKSCQYCGNNPPSDAKRVHPDS